jgi:hypothetical protein
MSKAQTEANQQNGQLGGVKTPEGKKVSRINAVKYGFFSKIVTDYDKLEQQNLCNEIYTSFAPQTIYEGQLVEILLSNLLAYRRISLVEHELMLQRLNPRITKNIMDDTDAFIRVDQEGYLPKVGGDVVDELEKFQRYKTATVNLILKTQHELERLARLRAGEAVPSPVAVDVTVAKE